jgi:hypothetical protein
VGIVSLNRGDEDLMLRVPVYYAGKPIPLIH